MQLSIKHKPLSNNQLHVWHFSFNNHLNNVPFYTELLSGDEKTKASKFRFEKDKNQFIISRGILRVLSSHYLKIPAKDIIFKYGTYGKPKYSFNSDLKFNVSHSRDMGVIGFVENHDIGIDIEKIKDDFDVLDIAVNYFSEKEISELKSLPKSKHVKAFYRCWTRKESFIKAKSKGLSFALDSFSVSIDSDEKAELLETKWDEEERNIWKLYTFSPGQDYIGAVSIQGDISTIKYFDLRRL